MDFIFKVDPIRRNIKVPDAFTVLTMDHNVHKLVFVCPYYEDFAFDSASIVFMIDAPDGRQYSVPAEEYESFPNSPSPHVKFTLTLKSYITSVPGYISFCITADIISSGNIIEKSWHSKNISISVGGHINNDDSEDIPEEDVPTINQRLNNLDSKVGRLQTTVNGMANGTPPTASSTSEMYPDESMLYINTTDGNWYYYDGSEWQIGGVYGGATTSTTFNQHGVPADDFAVGEALAEKADADDVGDLSQLTTTAKDNLVSAINEVNEAVTGINDRLVTVEDYFDNPNVMDYGSLVYTNRYPNTSGTIINGVTSKSVIFPVEPETEYYLKVVGGYNRRNIVGDSTNAFDVGSTYTLISSASADNVTGIVFTTPANVNYVLIQFYAGDYTYNADNFLLFKGNTLPSDLSIKIKSDVLPEGLLRDDSEVITDIESALYSDIGITYTSKPGKYVDTSNNLVSSSNYAFTFPVYLNPGKLTINARGTSPVSILSQSNADGAEFQSLVPADGTNQYTYTVTTAGYYVFSYRVSDGLTITQRQTIKAKTDTVQNGITSVNDGHLVKSPSLTFNNGYISTTGAITASETYKYSDPFFVLPGTISLISAGSLMAVISRTNKGGTVHTPVILGENPNALVKYSYTVEEAGYYCICYKTSFGIHELTVNENVLDWAEDANNLLTSQAGDITLKAFTQPTITPNFTIKAFKTLNYSDKTLPKYSQVLWNNPVDDGYYISDNVYSAKYKIFDWDGTLSDGLNSTYYQAIVLPNGDILFVFQTQFYNASDTAARGAYRRNPIIYVAANNYVGQIIDFGNETKPTGWLQNIGALYSYTHNRLYIAEYTRPNEQYAHIWAVDMPVTTISNWHDVLTKEITPDAYESGFKHFHTCQEDPFTNILYFSSGDNDISAAVWYSTDGGNTLIQLDDYDAGKYRMLNMAFTKEYVYWASDHWYPEHLLWRITRDADTGILDVSTLTQLLSFDDELVDSVSRIATYTTVFMPCYNCLAILDRDDDGRHSKVPIRIYDIDSGNLYTVGNLYPLSSGVRTGFRNVAITCYPKTNEIICSFDAKHVNNNKLLGNNTTSRINNLILRVYKSGGTSYSIDFDTVY